MNTPQTRKVGYHMFKRWKLDRGWLVWHEYDDCEQYDTERWIRTGGKKVMLTHYVQLGSDRVADYLRAEAEHIEKQVKTLQAILGTIKEICHQ